MRQEREEREGEGERGERGEREEREEREESGDRQESQVRQEREMRTRERTDLLTVRPHRRRLHPQRPHHHLRPGHQHPHPLASPALLPHGAHGLEHFGHEAPEERGRVRVPPRLRRDLCF